MRRLSHFNPNLLFYGHGHCIQYHLTTDGDGRVLGAPTMHAWVFPSGESVREGGQGGGGSTAPLHLDRPTRVSVP